MTLRVVIADDEAVARSRLRRLLAAHGDVVIAAEAADGRSAVDAIITHRPDVVFLDIRMPELDGFEVLQALAPDEIPAIVFVTAYSDHAPRAFDVSALDYLLKPFEPARLADTLDRARGRRHVTAAESRRLMGVLETLAREQRALRSAVSALSPATTAPGDRQAPARVLERILVSRRGHGVFIAVRDIDYIESGGNYVRLHLGDEQHQVRIRLSDVEAQLDPATFVRIHRTVIVNVASVAEIQPWFSGDAIVIMRNGRKLRLSRHYRGALSSHFRLAGQGDGLG